MDDSMNNLKLEVSLIAGVNFVKAVEEARTLARKLNIGFVKFNFNGVDVMVSQRADAVKMEKDYGKVLKKKFKFVCD